MYKKTYHEWMATDDYDMEELRSLFVRMTPFNHMGEERLIHASNRLFAMTLNQAENNDLVGRNGIPSIRVGMSMKELLYDILICTQGIQLLPSDIEYYLNTVHAYSQPLSTQIVALIMTQQPVYIVWTTDNPIHPTQMSCKLINTQIEQELFHVNIILNDEHCYELDI